MSGNERGYAMREGKVYAQIHQTGEEKEEARLTLQDLWDLHCYLVGFRQGAIFSS